MTAKQVLFRSAAREKVLRERGVPMLVVESDYHNLDVGPMRTRLEAFVEVLSGGPADA